MVVTVVPSSLTTVDVFLLLVGEVPGLLLAEAVVDFLILYLFVDFISFNWIGTKIQN